MSSIISGVDLKRPSPMQVDQDDGYNGDIASFDDSKRRRIEAPVGDSLIQQSASNDNMIPTVPLLYHTALSAHHAAHFHLRQAFVPAYVSIPQDHSGPPIPLQMPGTEGPTTFRHDPHGASKSLGLLVLALDLLRAGLNMPGLSDIEKAAFGLEFTNVGLKLISATDQVKQLWKAERASITIVVDLGALQTDMEDTISKSLAIAQRSAYMDVYRQGLELASARLAFLRDKSNHGKRIVRQALSLAPKDQLHHRFSLHLLLMDHLDDIRSSDFFVAAAELEAEAQAGNHSQVVQIVHLARLKALFTQRKWDRIHSALEDCASAIGWSDTEADLVPITTDTDEQISWRLSCVAHLLIFRALYESRLGDDQKVKTLLRRLYVVMDHAADGGSFSALRSSGGVVKILLASASLSAQKVLHVQATPINVLYALTYLTTVVSRRDFMGPSTTCRSLVHARAMREWATVAKADEFWDSGFSPMHGLSDSITLQKTMGTILVEDMLEEILALICRSDFLQADKVLHEVEHHMSRLNLFDTHGPQLALLYAQFSQLIGLSTLAVRYYQAAQHLIIPGSELRLVIDIGLLSALGRLENLKDDHDRAREIDVIADSCRAGSNAILQCVGNFLSSLTDLERVSSKRKLTQAYEICRKGNYNILHCCIFAFTTGVHIYGDVERQLKQLETGRVMAHLLGGKDRPDGIGQTILGLWYAVKLRDQYRLAGRFDDQAAMQHIADLHIRRISEIREYGLRRFAPQLLFL